ncbi:hypothetical protein L596_018879 [Steinernema carpocapsae]|uniref:mRNA-decapping enzyme 2 n=1 Tax=Steinernema carpocapsae TaxID=34508 RepID=A0A4U5N750_STECR|nr:hypothetical protein L596_018879 [Steinernema carpocapsae]
MTTLDFAHWYYVDFYCGGESDISLREFSKQVCMRSEGRRFSKHGRKIDSIIDSFHDYKRSVPVNGAVLLDSTLTYVLLVQGMSATQDSWGFPKGKVNENEDPLDCAAREVLEEVGYDCTGKIHPRKCSQKFVKKTCIRLYFVKDVPIEFDFKPRVRNEIRKIQWFKLSELPNDYSSFADVRKGPEKRNFYVVFPFVDDIQAYVKNELKQINTSHRIPRSHLRSGGESSRSAFKPVSPSRRQSQCGAIEAALHPRNSPKGTPPKPQSAQTFVELLAAVNKKSANQFIPVKETSPPRFESAAEDKDLLASDEPGPSSQGATSIKLDSFMQMFSKANQENKVPTDLLVSCDVLESQIGATSPEQSETTTKKALAAIGSESADKRKKKERQSEIKQPKARRYPVNEPVYEAEGDPTDAGGEATGENEPEETPTNSGVEFDDADFYYTPVSERRPTPGPNAVAEEHEDKTPKKKPRKPRRKKNSSGSKPEETEGPAQLEEPKHRDSIYEQGIAIDLHSLLNSAGTYGGTCSRSALSEQQISHEANRCRSETDSASISTSAEVRVVPCESWKRPVKIDVADLFAMFS